MKRTLTNRYPVTRFISSFVMTPSNTNKHQSASAFASQLWNNQHPAGGLDLNQSGTVSAFSYTLDSFKIEYSDNNGLQASGAHRFTDSQKTRAGEIFPPLGVSSAAQAFNSDEAPRAAVMDEDKKASVDVSFNESKDRAYASGSLSSQVQEPVEQSRFLSAYRSRVSPLMWQSIQPTDFFASNLQIHSLSLRTTSLLRAAYP